LGAIFRFYEYQIKDLKAKVKIGSRKIETHRAKLKLAERHMSKEIVSIYEEELKLAEEFCEYSSRCPSLLEERNQYIDAKSNVSDEEGYGEWA
jgi:hypothetical protein